MSLCGHTSIIALFRFELQNNFSIPVELHITYLLPTLVERTSLHANRTQITNRYSQHCVIDRCLGQSQLMQASVSTVGQPSFLQTTYKFDVRRHWDAVSTQTQCHIHIVPKIKHPRFHKNCDLFSPSRRLSAGFN